ncbi:Molybdate-binding periplasmic protein [Thalassocella blandensis]|nr:Molybdate-binding periplasmic protein [Thalassocella blandensis]
MKFSRKLIKQTCLTMMSCLFLICQVFADSPEAVNEGAVSKEKVKLNIAVAANFTPVLEVIVQQYSSQVSVEIAIVTGSTGKLYTQITHGAPFDVFLAADQQHPRLLVDNKLAVKDSQVTYAEGAIVLWSMAWQGKQAKVHLQAGDFQRLAIANPKIAPYGVAARQAMQALGVQLEAEQKLLEGTNIAQAFHFVRFGNADLGFVSLSQIKQYERMEKREASYWLVPQQYFEPIKQDLVLLQHATTSTVRQRAAEEFLAYLKGEEAKQLIRTFGYTVQD